MSLLRSTNSIQSLMSHFTTIKTQIRDTEALRAACSELGLELIQNAEARGYYTQTTKGEYVIRLKGPYDMPSLDKPTVPTVSRQTGTTIMLRPKSVPITAS